MMTERLEVLETIVPVIRKYLPERRRDTTITEDTHLSSDLGINSAFVVDIVLTLEELLTLEPGDTYAFATIADLVDYVLAQRNGRPERP
jgi:acyl carrier protein